MALINMLLPSDFWSVSTIVPCQTVSEQRRDRRVCFMTTDTFRLMMLDYNVIRPKLSLSERLRLCIEFATKKLHYDIDVRDMNSFYYYESIAKKYALQIDQPKEACQNIISLIDRIQQ